MKAVTIKGKMEKNLAMAQERVAELCMFVVSNTTTIRGNLN